MAAQFVRLKLTLMANVFRRSVWQTIGFILGALYGLSLVVLVVAGMIALGTTDLDLAAAVLTLAGTLLVLGWWVIPLFAYGVDATLDPQRFVLYAISQRRLLSGLALAGVVSIPGVATLLAALGSSFAWWRSPLALLAALVGAVLGVATCVIGSRTWTTTFAPLLESRRYREVVTVAAFVPLVLIGPAIAWVTSQLDGATDGDAVRDLVGQLADIAGWTPFGASWALASAVHDGAWGLVLARVAISLLTLGVIWVVWDRALARALVTPPTAGAGGRAKGLGWFSRLPATPVGAVAARCLTYWVRDPRYSGSIAVVPLIPVILLVVGNATGSSEAFLVLAPFTAWILGFSISADIAYDHTAFALHVSTGVTGRVDRWGRAIPVLVIGLPVTVLFAVVSAGVASRWDALPAVLGGALGMLLVTLGVSSAVSARLMYPVAKPGDSPFKQPQGATMATLIAQSVTMLVVFVLALPVVVLGVLAVLVDSLGGLGWVALVVGPVLGVVFLVLGVRWGAKTYDRRSPEILQQVLSYA